MLRYVRSALVALSILGLFGALAPQVQAQPLPNAQQGPSAQIALNVVKGGYFIGGTAGSGMLSYQGQYYPVSVGALSLGVTFGLAAIDVVGDVYYLYHPADLEGTYTAVSGDAAFIVGMGTAELQNEHGVVLRVRSQEIGVLFSVDLSGMQIWYQ